MKKKLREAIENIDMVNNIDGQDFDKEFVGTAPVSYADAVLRARKHREDAKKGCEEQTKLAEEVLKKEISNVEHPEPLDKIKVNEEGKMTLDEGLFESLAEERSDTSLAKEALDEIIERIHLGMSELMELLDLDISDDARSRIDDAVSDIAQVLDRLSLVARKYLKESFDDEHLGHGDDVCPKCGKNPCECKVEESLYPEYVSYQGKKMRVQGIRHDGKYALSEPKYSGLDITNHPEYLIDVDKDEVETLDECVINESYLREASHIIPKESKRKVLIVEGEASIECVLSTVVNTTSNTLGGGSEERSVGFRVITDSIPSSFGISFFDEDKQKEFYESVPKKFDSVKQFIDYLVDIYNSYPRTSAPYNIRNIAKDLGYKDKIDTIEEGVHSEIEEGAEEKKVYRVTYKHSPEVFSSVMVKAANEDEAKQKLSVKKPGKDIVGVSVMSDDEVSDMTNRGMSLMEAKVVDDFSSYEPWDAAVSTFDNIQNAGKMDALEQLIDDMYPDGINRTELNDLLAYESDWVYSMLDMPSEEAVDEEDDGPAVDFEEEE